MVAKGGCLWRTWRSSVQYLLTLGKHCEISPEGRDSREGRGGLWLNDLLLQELPLTTKIWDEPKKISTLRNSPLTSQIEIKYSLDSSSKRCEELRKAT
jgi:hypothetical protein